MNNHSQAVICLILSISLVSFSISETKSQTTWDEVYTIFQTSCVTGCHVGPNPDAGLNLGASKTDVYNALIEIDPTNSASLAKGEKLVDPGYPYRSYLLRKIAWELETDLHLDQANEGDPMPIASGLANHDIELVRQWIVAGAPETGEVVPKQRLVDFYSGLGLPRIQQPTVPAASEGFQIHLGPIFISPGQEIEFLKIHDMVFPGGTEITGMESFMNTESHHFIIYKYNGNGGSGTDDGTRYVNQTLDLLDVNFFATVMATWQFSREHTLPDGTAFYLGQDAKLDLNYHIPNTHIDSILAAEVYINFTNDPGGTGNTKMHSALASYGGQNPYSLVIPPTGVDTTYHLEHYFPGSTEIHNYWIIQGHTHQWGTV